MKNTREQEKQKFEADFAKFKLKGTLMSEENVIKEAEEVVETSTDRNVLIRTQVKAVLDSSNKEVEKSVVEALAADEIKSRKDLVLKTLTSLDTIDANLKKIKPDITTYVGDEMTEVKAYSAEKKKEKDKAIADRGKIQLALNKALDSNDWKSLKELVK